MNKIQSLNNWMSWRNRGPDHFTNLSLFGYVNYKSLGFVLNDRFCAKLRYDQ